MSATSTRIDLHAALTALRAVRKPGDAIITTMAAARAWAEMGAEATDLMFVPSAMGHATSIGLGLAMAQPSRGLSHIKQLLISSRST